MVWSTNGGPARKSRAAAFLKTWPHTRDSLAGSLAIRSALVGQRKSTLHRFGSESAIECRRAGRAVEGRRRCVDRRGFRRRIERR